MRQLRLPHFLLKGLITMKLTESEFKELYDFLTSVLLELYDIDCRLHKSFKQLDIMQQRLMQKHKEDLETD